MICFYIDISGVVAMMLSLMHLNYKYRLYLNFKEDLLSLILVSLGSWIFVVIYWYEEYRIYKER